MALTSDQKEQLTNTAQRRAGRGYLLGQVIYPGISLVVGVVVAVVELFNHQHSAKSRLTEFAVIIVLSVIVGLTSWFMYRRVKRNASMVAGADRDTRRSVSRALRHGSSAASDVNELVTDQRDHWQAHRAGIWFSAAIMLAAGVFLLVRAHSIGGIAAGAFALALVVAVVIRHHQLKRYQG
jgi:hypothetical protein